MGENELVGNAVGEVVGFSEATMVGESVVGVAEGPKVGGFEDSTMTVGGADGNTVGFAVGSGDVGTSVGI